jgi:replicative DNA helicase
MRYHLPRCYAKAVKEAEVLREWEQASRSVADLVKKGDKGTKCVDEIQELEILLLKREHLDQLRKLTEDHLTLLTRNIELLQENARLKGEVLTDERTEE